MAICLKEILKSSHQKVQIFATDLNEHAIAKARIGKYSAGEVSNIGAARLDAFFTKNGDEYQINSNIRDMCVFAPHNFLSDPPFGKIDFISCRNVLIYLNRIAQEQARAMAARDVLEHDLAGSFSSRMASSRSGRAAENIAYGHSSFTKTLDQWIHSSGHRRNLLMQGASKVGVASATSAKTGRTYWAMVIAGDYEPPRRVAAKTALKTSTPSKPRGRERPPPPCRMSLMGLCLQR